MPAWEEAPLAEEEKSSGNAWEAAPLAEEQPLAENLEKSFAEQHRTGLRGTKNVAAGAAGRVIDAGPLLPAILGQTAARVPGWLAQGAGAGMTALGDTFNSPVLKEYGDIASMGGEMANEDIGRATQKVTGQPFFSGLGLVNQASEAAAPILAPQNKDEAASDAFWQTLAGGVRKPSNIRGNIGNLVTAAGVGESVKTDNPLWAAAGLAVPAATSYATKRIASSIAARTPAAKLVEQGYNPDVFAGDVGGEIQDVFGKQIKQASDADDIIKAKAAQDAVTNQGILKPHVGPNDMTTEVAGKGVSDAAEKARVGWLPLKEEVATAIGETPIHLPKDITPQVSKQLGLAKTDSKLLSQFETEVNRLKTENAGASAPGNAISAEELATIRKQYGPEAAEAAAKQYNGGVTPEGHLTFNNLQELKEKYGFLTDRENPAVKATSSKIYGYIKDAETEAAKAVGVDGKLNKFNEGYSKVKGFQRDYTHKMDGNPSGVFKDLHKNLEENPQLYREETSVLPAQEQIQLRQAHNRELGGGNTFNEATWAKNFDNLAADSKDALAGGNPKIYKQLQETADRINANQVAPQANNLAQAEAKFGAFLKSGKQAAAGKMVKTIQEEPELFAEYIKTLPPETQAKVTALAHKEMGGGDKFSPVKWSQSFGKLDPESKLALVGGDAARLEKLEEIAKNAGKIHPILNAAAKAAGYAAWSTGGFHGYLLSKALTNPAMINNLSVLAKPGNVPPATRVKAVNALTTIMRQQKDAKEEDDIPDSVSADSIEGGAKDDKIIWEKRLTPPEKKKSATLITLPSDIEAEEGLRLKPYKDTRGKTTVGIGFNMDNPSARKIWSEAGIKAPFQAVKQGRQALTEAEAKKLAQKSYEIAQNDTKRLYPNFNKLSKNRQAALTNLSYQLGGPKLAEFDKANKAIRNGKFDIAAKHLALSAWAKQTPERAKRIIAMLKEDKPYGKQS